MDFIDKEGLCMIEVNPRLQATLDIVERAFDSNLFLLHEKAYHGSVEKMKNPQKIWGKAILYAEKNIIIPEAHAWLDQWWMRDIPHPRERILKSEPICTIIADGNDRNDCFEHLTERAEFVRAEIY